MAARPHFPSPPVDPRLHGALAFADTLAEGAKFAFDYVDLNGDDLLFLQYTGGKFGLSKGASLSHRNLVGYQAVSPKMTSSIAVWNCCQIVRLISVRNAAGRQADQAQLARSAENAGYQAVSRQYQDNELMLQIGLLLGLAYLAFLAIWVWATRLRPH